MSWRHLSPIPGHPFLADLNCDLGVARPTRFGVKFAVAGDFDGDGQEELIVAPDTPGTAGNDLWAMKLLEAPDTETHWEHMSPMPGHELLADLNCDLGAAIPTRFGVKFAVAGDFDGDGQEELIVAPDITGTAGNDLWAMKFNVSARLWEHMSPMAGHEFMADLNCDLGSATPVRFGIKLAVAGDFDGDGQEELIVVPDVTGTAGSDLWAMKFNRLARQWEHMSPIPGHPFLADLSCTGALQPPPSVGVKLVVAGDFDGDGQDELVVAPDRAGTAGNDFWVMKLNRPGQFWEHLSPIADHELMADLNCDEGAVITTRFGVKFAVAGDFDGDGREELIVAPDITGTAGNDLWAMKFIVAGRRWIHLSPIPGHELLADLNCDEGAAIPARFGAKFALAGDFDGDGQTELLVAPDSTGTAGNDLWVMKLDNATRRWIHLSPIPGHELLADLNCDDGAAIPTRFGVKFAVAGDFNGNHLLDLVVAPDLTGTAGNDLWAMGRTPFMPAPTYAGSCRSNNQVLQRIEPWNNWHGNQIRGSVATVSPADARSVAAAVLFADANARERGAEARAGIEGSAWSYTECVVGGDTQLLIKSASLNNSGGPGRRPARMRHVLPMAIRNRFRHRRAAFVHVGAGIKIYELSCLLDSLGLAMPTLGGSRGQSLAGAISTGTHGGDIDRAPIADAVRAVHLVGAGGQEWWIEPSNGLTNPLAMETLRQRGDLCRSLRVVYSDHLFNAVLVAFGCAGVICSLVIEAVPAFRLHSATETRAWEEARSLIAGLPSDPNRPRFLEVIVNPGTRSARITRRSETVAPISPRPAGPDMAHAFLHALLRTTGPADPLTTLTAAVGAYIAEKTAEASLLFAGLPFTAGELRRVESSINFAREALEALVELTALTFDPHNQQRIADLLPTVVNLLWRLRFLGIVDAIQEGQISSLRPDGEYVDVGFKVSTDQPDCGAGAPQIHGPIERLVQSFEFGFPLDRALVFVDRLIDVAASFRGGENALIATFNLRVTRRSRALMAMQRFDRTCHVEVYTFTGINGNAAFHERMNALVRELDGVPHWGQLHETGDRLISRFGLDLAAWQREMAFLADTAPWYHMSPISAHPFLADFYCDGGPGTPTHAGVKLAVAGDFDGDGRDELIVAPDITGTAGNDLWAMKLNVSARRWDHMSPMAGHELRADLNCDLGASIPVHFGVKLAVAGDFDGDGRDELIVAPDITGTAGNDLWAMKLNVSARRWEHMSPMAGHEFVADLNCDLGASIPVHFGVKLAVAGDFDGDGRDELIVAPDITGTAGNDLWAMKLNVPARRWEHMSPIAGHEFVADLNCDLGASIPVHFGVKLAVAGDFDGDGRDELIVAPDITGTGANDLWAMKLNVSIRRWEHMSPIPGHPFVADLNCDLGAARPADFGVKLAVVGDFDGDGRDELAVIPDVTGTGGNDFWVMKLNVSTRRWEHMSPIPGHPFLADLNCDLGAVNPPLSGVRFAVAGDLDGDGREELIVAPDLTGPNGNDLWAMKLNSAARTWEHMSPIPGHEFRADINCDSGATLPTGLIARFAVVGRFSGDAREELIVAPGASGRAGNEFWALRYPKKHIFWNSFARTRRLLPR